MQAGGVRERGDAGVRGEETTKLGELRGDAGAKLGVCARGVVGTEGDLIEALVGSLGLEFYNYIKN